MTDPVPQSGRRFHVERWSAVIAAVAGFVIINTADFGVCSSEGGSSVCVIGDTVVTETSTLFLVYTPLIFGPIAYLIAGVTPVWRQPMGLGAQIIMVATGLSIIASGFAVMGWGSGTGALVAFIVGGVGVYLGIRSWRDRQRAG